MPNWKSYESSVRLLSAIIAAHPQLKLNYDEVARFFGGGAKYKQIYDQMVRIKEYAKRLENAVTNGEDPMSIEFNEGGAKPKGKALSASFGGDCTKSAMENRFRRIKADAKLINNAVEKGIDPITLPIGDTDGEVAVRGKSSYEMSRACGSDTTAIGIMRALDRHVRPNVKLIQQAWRTGQDPKDLNIGADGPSKAIQRHFGSDTTLGGLSIAMYRNITPKVNLILRHVAAGGDPKDLKLVDEAKSGGKGKNLAKIMGTDVTPNGLKFQFTDRIRPIAQRQLQALESGADPKDVDLNASAKGSKKDLSKYFGKDSTPGGIEFQFRAIKTNAKRQKACADAGGDPQSLKIGSGKGDDAAPRPKKIALCLNDGTTAFALQHRFRGIKREAADMRNAISHFMNNGTTAAAIEHRFRPIKKEAENLKTIAGQYQQNASGDPTTKSTTSTPRKSTPAKGKKATPSSKMTDSFGGNNDDDDEEEFSPSKKKNALNKVKGGRIAKTPARSRKGGSQPSHVEDDVDDMAVKYKDEDGDDMKMMQPYSQSSGNGYGQASQDGSGYSIARFGSGQDDVSYGDGAEDYYDVDDRDEV